MPGSLLIFGSAALLLVTAEQALPRLRPPSIGAAAPPQAAGPNPERPLVIIQPRPAPVPIDLGPDAPRNGLPPMINILLLPPPPGEPTPAMVKACEDEREAGIVAGEIVVCRELVTPNEFYFSGSHEAWFNAYAWRTRNVGTIPTPDVAGPGIFRGPVTIANQCFIPPCPKPPAIMLDVEAIPLPPAGSDAERVARGQVPIEDDMAPLTAEERRMKQAELGLPDPASPTFPRSP